MDLLNYDNLKVNVCSGTGRSAGHPTAAYVTLYKRMAEFLKTRQNFYSHVIKTLLGGRLSERNVRVSRNINYFGAQN